LACPVPAWHPRTPNAMATPRKSRDFLLVIGFS
jgi:hypothetical protein